MSAPRLSLSHLSPEQVTQLKALTSPPRMAWPTLIMWLVLTVAFVSTDIAGVRGIIPLWLGMLINTSVGYMAFSVGHDSIHRSISSNARLNDLIGQLGLFLVLPYVNVKLFRWCHILHHRFANGPRDPDIVLKGSGWTLPFRWMFIDGFYLIHALRNGDNISRPALRRALWASAVFFSLIAVLVSQGYGLDVLMLWFLPSRFILLTLGFSFFWLPHVPHNILQEENYTAATTIREGHEWLLGPILQYQNAHLIHHLYPMTPFYNNVKVWKLMEPELRKHDLSIQYGFSISSVRHPAPSSPA